MTTTGFKGLRTALCRVDDLERGKAWYAQASFDRRLGAVTECGCRADNGGACPRPLLPDLASGGRALRHGRRRG